MAVQALQEAVLESPTSPIETYSCDLHILDPAGDSLQVACMTADKCHQTKRADPVLSFMIVRMQDGILARAHANQLIHLNSTSSFVNETTSS